MLGLRELQQGVCGIIATLAIVVGSYYMLEASPLNAATLAQTGPVGVGAQTSHQKAIQAKQGQELGPNVWVPLGSLIAGVTLTAVVVWRAAAEKNKIASEMAAVTGKLDLVKSDLAGELRLITQEFKHMKELMEGKLGDQDKKVKVLFGRAEKLEERMGRVEGKLMPSKGERR